MWEALEAAHSGTKGVKARRVEMLVEEFHKFAMISPTEPIRELELRFTHLINNLTSLGKDIPEEEQVSKILKVLKGDWITKVTILQEVQGESTSSITALFGSLAEYEPTLLAQRAPQATSKTKNLALVAPSKEKIDDNDDDEDDEEDIDDEETAMMVRKFRKFFKKKGGLQKGDSSQRKGYKKERALVCFECKKPGHFKAECPSLQRSKGKDKRKAFVSSIWVNSSDEEASDEEEVANLCLVAREDDEEASF